MALSKAERQFRTASVRSFPKLSEDNFAFTSPQDHRYNCIAWAVGEKNRWWWPVQRYWPGVVPRSTSVDAFVMMFESRGYVMSESRDVEPGFEKVAIYVDALQRVTHAARQIDGGRWTSKLGAEQDISHTLEAIEGGDYGKVATVLKRPLSPLPQAGVA